MRSHRRPTWGSTTNQILTLRGHLVAEQVSCVAMEANADYWKPFYYLLEDLDGVEVVLVNAREAKKLPGRKTDVSDAPGWPSSARTSCPGFVRATPTDPELRDLTRTRTAITRERSREVRRLEQLLEDAGIKLSSVATDIVGVSGRATLHALSDGERDPVLLADLAQRRLRAKTPQLVEALTGRFTWSGWSCA